MPEKTTHVGRGRRGRRDIERHRERDIERETEDMEETRTNPKTSRFTRESAATTRVGWMRWVSD